MRAKEFTVEANVIPMPGDRKSQAVEPGSKGDIRPFTGRSMDWQKLETAVLKAVYDWYWATVKRDSLFTQDDPRGFAHDAIKDVLIIENRIREMGYQIKINTQGNIELMDKFNQTKAILPTQDAIKGTGWATRLD